MKCLSCESELEKMPLRQEHKDLIYERNAILSKNCKGRYSCDKCGNEYVLIKWPLGEYLQKLQD